MVFAAACGGPAAAFAKDGHHDKDVDGVDDLGYVGGSDFHIDEMSENMVPITLFNRL